MAYFIVAKQIQHFLHHAAKRQFAMTNSNARDAEQTFTHLMRGCLIAIEPRQRAAITITTPAWQGIIVQEADKS